MASIRLDQVRDANFLHQVEEESGQNISTCYQCGNCTAGCPAGFVYDRQVNQIMRGVQLGLKDEVLNSRSIWLCLSCSTCSQRCPNNIDVAGILDTCRHMARREGKGGVHAVRAFWDSFLSSVGMNGKVHEIGLMALYVLRTGRFWTDMDLAPKVLPKGKMALMPHRASAAGRKEVADIFRRFQEGKSDEAVVKARIASTPAPASGSKDESCRPGATAFGLDASTTKLSQPEHSQEAKS